MKKFFQRLIANIKKHPKRYIYSALMVVLAGIFIGTTIFLISYFSESKVQIRQHEELIDYVQKGREEAIQEGGIAIVNPDGTLNIEPENPLINSKNVYEYVTNEDGETVKVLKEYATVYKMNNDVVGWIQIPGTKVNYPVLQRKDTPNYYLRRDFYEENARHGSIYAYEEADFKDVSDNITLFGHNMGDNTMFAGLHDYEKEEFYQAHPYILFDTLTSHQVYKVVSVFYTNVDVTNGFVYHDITDFEDEHAFYAFIEDCTDRAMYDTGTSFVYGDKLLTLSTCDNNVADDSIRFVVVAKKVSL